MIEKRNQRIVILLTKQERDVLNLLAFGKNMGKEIRKILFRSSEYYEAYEKYKEIEKSQLKLF